jgi:hypothetical protein
MFSSNMEPRDAGGRTGATDPRVRRPRPPGPPFAVRGRQKKITQDELATQSHRTACALLARGASPRAWPWLTLALLRIIRNPESHLVKRECLPWDSIGRRRAARGDRVRGRAATRRHEGGAAHRGSAGRERERTASALEAGPDGTHHTPLLEARFAGKCMRVVSLTSSIAWLYRRWQGALAFPRTLERSALRVAE